jgi:outer membrane scaffolding protein for murein synthesis (MipA/OmpV family)
LKCDRIIVATIQSPFIFGSVEELPKIALLFCCLLATSPVLAGQEVTEIPMSDWPTGAAALGAASIASQNLYYAKEGSDDWKADLIPLVLYNGKYIFFRGTAAGVHVLNRDAIELNLLARARLNRLDPGGSEFFAGLQAREQSLDGGAEIRLRGRWGELQSAWLTDTLDRHQGESAELSYRFRFQYGRLSLMPFVSWEWYDDDLTNYYFGVSSDEAQPGRPEYAPGSSNWISLGLNTSYALNDRTTFFANMSLDTLDSAVENSPIVDARTQAAFYVGGAYVFGNTLAPAVDYAPERTSEWSWRINFGYAAEDNVVGGIEQGVLIRSTHANTRIGGITLGKLIAAGPRADVSGRLAIHKHFEANDGNGRHHSYALYIMVMSKGWEAWSREPLFRWGFGFGLSYAAQIPVTEQREQGKEGKNTSHLLSYMEMQLDVPLRRFIKARPVKNCYAGLTVVHRSGIFGRSDVLGDVSGGADWITMHLECARL